MFRYLCRKIRLNIYFLQCDVFKCALINKLYEMVMLTALLIVLFMKEDFLWIRSSGVISQGCRTVDA